MAKRIGIDARCLLMQQRGMPAYVTMLCDVLPRTMPEYQFYFFVNLSYIHNEDTEGVRLERYERIENVQIVNIGSRGSIAWEWILLPLYLLYFKIDLIHMPCNRVSLFSTKRQVVTLHDAIEWTELKIFKPYNRKETFGTNLRSLLWRINIFLNYRFGMNIANRVSSISRSAKIDIECNLPFLNKEIEYVHHGLPDGYSINQKPKPMAERSHILMLGGDAPQKNPETAIEAWYKLPPAIRHRFPLVIAGFNGAEDSVIIKKLRELDILDEVKILNWIDTKELVSLFDQSLAFLFLSKAEGFGFPVIQSMARGTPVITSNASSLVELGGSAIYSHDAFDSNGISQTLNHIANDAFDWQKASASGLKLAESFTWESVASFWQSQYVAVLEKDN